MKHKTLVEDKSIPILLEALEVDGVRPGCYYDGLWRGVGSVVSSLNPTDNTELGKLLSGSQPFMDNAIEAAHKSFLKWRDVPAPERGEMVRQIGDALRENKDHLGKLVSLEMGKILQEGLGEVQEMIDICDFAVGQSRMMYGKTMHSERYHHRMYEQYQPLGVVGVISAFNFPVAVWAWNAMLAAVCGNTVIWKPSPKAPLCSVAVTNIVNKVMEANGHRDVFVLVNTDDVEVIESMVTHPKIPLISFTGSTEVGRLVNQLAAVSFKKTILELGGNNAIIVDVEADLDLAIPAIVFGAVGTAGQRCTSTRRVFVHKSQMDEVSTRIKEAYHQIKMGNPTHSDTLMGPLVDKAAKKMHYDAIDELTTLGATFEYGAVVMDDREGNFVQPVLIKCASNDWDIVQRETFSPILYLIEYDTLEEAFEMHNDVPQGLSSAIFTKNMQVAELFLSHLGSDCGIANVNIGTSGAEIGGSFGGTKDTGGGRESGGSSWQQYMRLQTNTINWSDDLPLAQGIEFKL